MEYKKKAKKVSLCLSWPSALFQTHLLIGAAVSVSPPSALRFSAAPLVSGAGTGTGAKGVFFFTTIDVRSFTRRFWLGTSAALSSPIKRALRKPGRRQPVIVFDI